MKYICAHVKNTFLSSTNHQSKLYLVKRMSHRNFLRKQVIEYQEFDGFKRGFQVNAIVNNQLEQGTVKWIGTIKGTMYIGIQFERPVGNQFPQMNGAAPFPCSVSHSRLVHPDDVKLSAAGVMDQERHHLHQLQQTQDDDNYLHASAASVSSYLCVDLGSVSAKPYANQTCHSRNNICRNSISDSRNESQRLVSTSVTDFDDTMEMNEFQEKLSLFYKYCAQAKRLIKEFHVRFEELQTHCRFEDCATLSLNLEKVKSFRGDLKERLMNQLELCKLGMDAVMTYPEILLPSEERKMSQELQEIDQSYIDIGQDIYTEIETLENFAVAYQSLQDFLQERFSRFAVIKTRLVQVERNLVKDESALSLRIKGMQSILSVLERDHDTSENSQINHLVSEIKMHDYMDTSRVLMQTQDLILSEKNLLEDVRTKRALLIDAKESYQQFTEKFLKFQKWYVDYMKRLNATKVTGLDFDVQHPSLVTEREEKRLEFIEILASARNLRASIFDSSAVDTKIESLQGQWKSLVEKVYRTRCRKTV